MSPVGARGAGGLRGGSVKAAPSVATADTAATRDENGMRKYGMRPSSDCDGRRRATVYRKGPVPGCGLSNVPRTAGEYSGGAAADQSVSASAREGRHAAVGTVDAGRRGRRAQYRERALVVVHPDPDQHPVVRIGLRAFGGLLQQLPAAGEAGIALGGIPSPCRPESRVRKAGCRACVRAARAGRSARFSSRRSRAASRAAAPSSAPFPRTQAGTRTPRPSRVRR